MGGPGVFPPLPPGVVTRGGWKPNEDPAEAVRRSVYMFVRRNTRYPMFEVFDMPDTHESCARRITTVTAPQALELLNNELVLDWSRGFAGRVLNDAGLTPEAAGGPGLAAGLLARSLADGARVRVRLPRPAGIHLNERLAKGEQPALPEPLPEGMDKARAGAMVDLCHMLVNSNEFVYVN